MEIHEVEKAKMDALRGLADTNLKISEARASLERLKTEESTYLESREKQVEDKIAAILQESEDIVKQTIGNYEAVDKFHQEVRNLASVIIVCVDLIEEREKKHREKVDAWERACNQQREALVTQKQVIESGNKLLNSDREGIAQQKKLLLVRDRQLRDERGTLDRAITRLKEGRI